MNSLIFNRNSLVLLFLFEEGGVKGEVVGVGWGWKLEYSDWIYFIHKKKVRFNSKQQKLI